MSEIIRPDVLVEPKSEAPLAPVLKEDRPHELWGFIVCKRHELNPSDPAFRLTFDELLAAMEQIPPFLASEFRQDRLSWLDNTVFSHSSPVRLTVALGKGTIDAEGWVDFSKGRHKRCGQQTHTDFIPFAANIDDKLDEILKQLPALMTKLKRRYQKARPDYVGVYLSYSATENSASVSDLNRLLRAQREYQSALSNHPNPPAELIKKL